jgi:thioredoxin-dependent peroxiredoxin
VLKPGDPAPDFVVGQTRLHRLVETKGGAVVFFFPKAFTPGCTREAQGFGREHERFEKAGYALVGVSRDRQETNDRFRESLGLPYALVGDPEGQVLRAYDVRWPLVGIARRVTYVIGKDGRIQEVLRGEFAAEAHVEGACSFVAKAPR